MELVNERSLTMRSATLLASAGLLLGLAMADVSPAAAQGGEHEEAPSGRAFYCCAGPARAGHDEP
jgi:hypothetical protein